MGTTAKSAAPARRGRPRSTSRCTRCRRAPRRSLDQRLCHRCHAKAQKAYRARQRDAQTLSPQMREAIRVAIASGAPTVLQSRDDGSLVVTRIADSLAPSAMSPAPLTRPAASAPPRPAARPIALVR